jgi:tetratricopeptide (TPR) repeat protein
MTPERWRQLESLYEAIQDLPDDEKRAVLERADPQLRTSLSAILQQDGSALERPAWVGREELIQVESLVSGAQLGPYRIEEILGAGGMGEVYRALDTRLGRTVAIKLLPRELSLDPASKLRFLREARAVSALNHPNIVVLYDISAHQDTDFLVMEYVPGRSLRDLIPAGGQAFDQVAALGSQAASALGAAHAAGIVHRDVKPANILVTGEGQVKVLDFGIAKLPSDPTEAHLTGQGQAIGTFAYMSPEQTRGEEVDARSDIFSLGCVLYEASTGQAPFQGPSALAVMHEIATAEPLPPSSLRPGLTPAFDALIAKCLRKDPRERVSSMAEVRAGLDDAARGARQPIESRQEAEAFVGRERESRHLEEHFQRMLAGAGKVVFLAGEAGIGKSALTRVFVGSVERRYPGLMLARGHAVEQYGTGEAYLPFLDALSWLLRDGHASLTATLRAHAPTWSLQFPGVHSSGDLEQLRRETAGATKDRMLREMGDALGVLASSAPVVLLLEDLHWADPSTVDLLRHLGPRIAAQRVLLLATLRPSDIQIGNHPLRNCMVEMQAHQQCDEIAVGLLNEKEIAELLDSRFRPNDFPGELAGLIRQRTDGQPLFTVSLLDYLASRGDLVCRDSHWTLAATLGEMDLGIPDNVRAMIRKKSEALDPDSRLALQYASVEGEEFLSTVLARLLESDEVKVEEQLAALAGTHRLIERRGEEELPDGVLATRYGFVHALYQNVFYDELVSKRRVLLHNLAGEQLIGHYGDSASRIAVQLVMHFERGRNWVRAIEFLLCAGANARSMYANMQAEAHYTHALSLAARLPPDIRAQTEFRIYERRAAIYLATSRFDPSLADCKEMIDRARATGSLPLECAALYTFGNTLFWAHRLQEMQSALEEGLRLAERTHSEPARLQSIALMAQGDLALGRLEDAETKCREVVEHGAAVDKRTLLGVLDVGARIMFFRSEYREAEELFRENLRFASEVGDAFEILKSHYFLTLTLANLGRISEALEVIGRAVEMARRNGERYWASRVPNCYGWIHRELQDFEGALSFDRDGAEQAGRLGVVEAEANSVINLTLDHFDAGANQQMNAAIQSAESILSRDSWFRWRFEMRLLAARAEQTFSRRNAVDLIDVAARYGARKYIVTGRTLLARIEMAEGNLPAAESQLEAAIAILNHFPAPLAAWKTYSVLGRLHAGLGRDDAARAAFGEAASIISYIAGNIGDERLRGIFLGSAAVRDVVNRQSRQATSRGQDASPA